MTTPHDPPPDRLHELLAARAVFGLSAAEAAELDRLLAAHPVADPDDLDRVAADVARAYVPAERSSLPPHLRSRILAAARGEATVFVAVPEARGRLSAASRVRWLLVAALVFAAVGAAWWAARPGTPTAADRRRDLLARAERSDGGVVRLDWTATADPAAAGASGDVVWSSAAQEGYMRFRGLPANDPGREQYQLWVFDAARDDRYPVDGGVFDVPAGGGDVVVPIRVKLPVSRPTVFAVTVEPPGGVVVSSRARLPLLANVPD